MRSGLKIALIGSALIGIAALGAQTTPGDPSRSPVFKTNARAVVVDVVVTKGNGDPITALKKQSFQVVEDGKPQTIDYFEEHTVRALPASALKPLPAMPPGVYTNVPAAPQTDAVNVLLIDTLNTEQQDQVYVRRQILNFLQGMNPGTRAAIFMLGSNLRFIQGFTSDSARLVAAVNTKSTSAEKDPSFYSRSDATDDKDDIAMLVSMLGGHTDGGTDAYSHAISSLNGIQFAQRAQMTFEALDYLARYLGGIPGRKNLIWFAGSFPVTVFPTDAQRQQMANDRVYASSVKKTADLLTLSKVAVYPINAQGMMDDHPMEANHNKEEAGSGAGLLQNIMEGAGERSETIFAMEQLAADTGGKAFYNTNDLNGAMQHAIDNGSHYYTLVYSPTNKKMDGKYRRIDVKLTDGHYKLAYRRGYNADDNVGSAPSADSDPLRQLLMRGLPSTTQLLYGVRVAPVSPQPAPNATRAGKNPKLTGPVTRYSIDFMIRWTDVALATTDSNTHTGKLQLGLMAYDREGNAVNWIGATQGMNLAPDVFASIQKSGVPGHMEIDLPDKDVYLVTGVYDWNSGKAGTLEIPLHPQTAVQSAAVKPN